MCLLCLKSSRLTNFRCSCAAVEVLLLARTFCRLRSDRPGPHCCHWTRTEPVGAGHCCSSRFCSSEEGGPSLNRQIPTASYPFYPAETSTGFSEARSVSWNSSRSRTFVVRSEWNCVLEYCRKDLKVSYFGRAGWASASWVKRKFGASALPAPVAAPLLVFISCRSL